MDRRVVTISPPTPAPIPRGRGGIPEVNFIVTGTLPDWGTGNQSISAVWLSPTTDKDVVGLRHIYNNQYRDLLVTLHTPTTTSATVRLPATSLFLSIPVFVPLAFHVSALTPLWMQTTFDYTATLGGGNPSSVDIAVQFSG